MATPPTIYIVDDDDAVRASLELLLEANGFRVVAYPSGEHFLAKPPSSDRGCLLVDVRMPGIGGLELQEELRRRNSPLPVVVMTGHGDIPLAVRAMQAGAADFIEKPFTETTILAGIERALKLADASHAVRAASAQALARVKLLTAREREVLTELVAGNPNKAIEYNLSISPRTVEIHRARVMEKMQARSLSEVVRMALDAGFSVQPAK
jgi:two-component system response regulator FixJ